MAIVLPAKVSLAYITALVWINIWAPMYAILHFIMSYYSQASMTELAALYGNGFSVFSNAEMAKFNSDVVATTGYLATALPMLAWILVSKSGAMAASFATRVMQGYDKSTEKEADQAKAAIYGAIEGRITAEVGTPLKGIFGSGASTSVATRLGGNVEGSTSETERDAYAMAEKFINSEQFSKVTASIGSGVHEMAATFGVKENESVVDQLSTSINNQLSAQRDYSEAINQVQTAKESLNATEELRSALNVDGGQTLVNALLGSNNGDVERVDTLLRNAASGSKQAMDEIKFALVDVDTRYDMSNDKNFHQVQDALFGDGHSAVNMAFDAGSTNTNQQSEKWRSDVDEKAQISKQQVNADKNKNLEEHQKTMNNPGRMITNKTHSDRLKSYEDNVNDQGAKTQEKVELASYINEISPIPFAAMWFNEGQRDQMEEKLKGNIQERNRKSSEQ